MSEVSESGRGWTIACLLAVFMLINFLDKIVLGLVAVPMMDELGLTPKQFGDIGSGFFWLLRWAACSAASLPTASRPVR